MKAAIDIRGLGKKYQIASNQGYMSLRDTLTKGVQQIFSTKETKKDFWALKNINLSINAGEKLGIIGRNGAGKSTLLKLLSRIAAPTTGEFTIRGRLASLLEVGTGFHPELTGRENIYFNGSILGLKKREIDRQFDEIVDFSGVSAFLELPLKNFSSGMQLRLAFAVAAHLQPEILLIDEVLAVGDLDFQRKCLGKMEEVSRDHGRTIVFVSHNLNFISSLCDTCVLLDQGQIIKTGNTSSVLNAYQQNATGVSYVQQFNKDDSKTAAVWMKSVSIINGDGRGSGSLSIGENVGIKIDYEVYEAGKILWFGHKIENQNFVNIFDTHSVNSDYYRQPHPVGTYEAIVWIPRNMLAPGTYFVSPAIFNHQENILYADAHHAIQFTLSEETDQVAARGLSGGDFPGIIRPLLNWSIKKSS